MIVLIITIILILVLLFWFFNNYPDPLYYETFSKIVNSNDINYNK